MHLKAATLNENRILSVDNVDAPKINDGEALVKVAMCGLCHTDLYFLDGYLSPPSYPHVLGHEITGVVTEAKPVNDYERQYLTEIQAQNSRVILYFYVTCGTCDYCLSARENNCPSLKRLGFELNGGYAEYVKLPIRNLMPLPASLDFESCVLSDAGATAFHALKKSGAKPGDNVVVVGVGGVGSMVLQIAKFYRANVVALDIAEEKTRFAEQSGADAAININGLSQEEIKSRVREATSGKGADVVVDLVGRTDAYGLCVSLLRNGGKLLAIGYSAESIVKAAAKDIIYKEIEIMGSRASTMLDLKMVVEMAQKRFVKAPVSIKFRLGDINKAFSDLRNNRILGRAVVLPTA